MFRTKCYILMSLVSYFVVVTNADSDNPASIIKPCKADDTACMTAVAQAAVPHFANGLLGAPVVDPIIIESVRSDENDLKLGFTKIKVTGVSKCKVIELSRNTKKSTIKLIVECPLHSVGLYDLKGKIFVIEAFGEGEFQIHTKNARIAVELKIKDIEKNGDKYWKVTGFDYSYDLLEKVHIDLKNLFNGDKERAKPLLQILETSSNELVQEVGGPLIKQLIAQFVECVKDWLLTMPCKKLELL